MQQPGVHCAGFKGILIGICLLPVSLCTYAQNILPDQKFVGKRVDSWFEANWHWVSGVMILLLLAYFFMGGSNSIKKRTTVFTDESGKVKRTVVETETI